MKERLIIDLHIHTTISDGTDTPEEILSKVKSAGIEIFSIADHDAIKSSMIIPGILKEGDPKFICSAEFSCKDEKGKYHILGYGYDPEASGIRDLVELGHGYRMNKVTSRMKLLKQEFGFEFPDEELTNLFSMDNPGKPHIGNLMVKYGYADTKEQAIQEYIDKLHLKNEHVRPEEAICGIISSGGIPVLAHPAFGSGDQLILGEDMDRRLRHLMNFGLKGVEAFYSGFSESICSELLNFACKYGLYVTAGSDYHGKNKLVELGDTGMDKDTPWPDGLHRFLADVV